MFVHYSTMVDLGLGDVERRLDDLRSHLEEWAGIAYRAGEDMKARVGPTETVARSVTLHLGRPEIHRRGVVYPVRWTANGGSSLFPDLRAELVLSALGKDKTSLTLDGTYDPPLGAVGRILDRAVMSRVAEATVRNWMDRMAESIGSVAGERRPSVK